MKLIIIALSLLTMTSAYSSSKLIHLLSHPDVQSELEGVESYTVNYNEELGSNPSKYTAQVSFERLDSTSPAGNLSAFCSLKVEMSSLVGIASVETTGAKIIDRRCFAMPNEI